MGLLWDISVNYDTVTQAGYFTLDRLPEVDQLMLRILYDPRLKAGMTREEAMPIVRKILPEYWEKYGLVDAAPSCSILLHRIRIGVARRARDRQAHL